MCDSFNKNDDDRDDPVDRRPKQAAPLHRVAEVMAQEGISPRTAAKRMNISEAQLRREMDPARDLRLSEIMRWQAALDVPISDLLVKPGIDLSQMVAQRADLLRVMKTLRSIQETSAEESINRLAERLEGLLVALMPELKDVTPWHTIGQRRSPRELGAITDRILPESLFGDSLRADMTPRGVRD